ncbi:RidA family protein [Nonomuraea lactucae]|uniref:RidA family protein n=1 Tax=Nonomuraea lactucae TaxID=2249762 RepID=UPI00308469E8
MSIATGSKLVFIAGQVAWDAERVTVGEGDLATQVGQCYLDIATALAEAGGSFDGVAKLNVHVVVWTPDKVPLLMEGITRTAAKLGPPPYRRPRCWALRHWTYPSIWSRIRRRSPC